VANLGGTAKLDTPYGRTGNGGMAVAIPARYRGRLKAARKEAKGSTDWAGADVPLCYICWSGSVRAGRHLPPCVFPMMVHRAIVSNSLAVTTSRTGGARASPMRGLLPGNYRAVPGLGLLTTAVLGRFRPCDAGFQSCGSTGFIAALSWLPGLSLLGHSRSTFLPPF